LLLLKFEKHGDRQHTTRQRRRPFGACERNAAAVLRRGSVGKLLRARCLIDRVEMQSIRLRKRYLKEHERRSASRKGAVD
jgi:hypothetical protein